jgi:NAD(P)-dependent dehydrogenase (short-subunit alcohol dehydrogenase family)
VVISARSQAGAGQLCGGTSRRHRAALDATDRCGAAAAQTIAGGAAGLRGVLRRALPRAARRPFNLDEMLRHEQVNYVGALHVLDAVLPHFLARRSGHISLVSSVAGYRGLPNSLAYGPTKAR